MAVGVVAPAPALVVVPGAEEPGPSGQLELPPGVCTRFLFARCRHGAACRYSHDIDRGPYVAAAAAAVAARAPPVLESRSNLSSAKGQPAAEGPLSAEPGAEPGAEPAVPRKAWRSVDWLLRGESVQRCAYLREFAAAPWLPRLLESPACASLLNVRGKSLRKELSEAFGALHAAERALAKLRGVGGECGEAEPAVVVDLCSGKGVASLVMALSRPRWLVIAVDSNPHMELGHFRDQPNLAFRQFDVTAPEAGARIAAAATEEATRAGMKAESSAVPTVIVGVHLCGPLSSHAARLFREAPAPAALALAPCCLDKGRPEVKRRAKRLAVDPHGYWCQELLLGVPGAAPCRRELLVDDDVLSARNTFIIAARPK